MSSLLHLLFLAGLVCTSSWVVAPYGGLRRAVRAPQFAVCMQEDAPTAAAEPAPAADAEAMDEFTEDLLDALAFDETPLSDPMSPSATWVKAEAGAEVETLEPRVGYTNSMTVDAARAKYKLHDNDTGSAQVQIAVLTARISYLTKHMQQNKKDNASLRGLQQMVVRRRKLLEYLLKEDIPEFKRLTAELGIRANQMLKPKLGGARGRRV